MRFLLQALLLTAVMSTIAAELSAKDKKAKAGRKAARQKIKEDNGILAITKENLDQALSENNVLLLQFHAPLSGASHELLSEFGKAAEHLKKENYGAALGLVDVPTQKELVQEFNVQDYPTLKYFVNGDRRNPLNCTGVRTGSSIVTWLKRRTGVSADLLTSLPHLHTFIDSGDVVVIGFFKDVKSKGTEAFYEAAKDVPDLPFGVTDNVKHFAKYNITRDTVALFRKFDERRVDYELADGHEMQKNPLVKFIKVNALPSVTEYNHVNSRKTFDVGIDSHLLLFTDKTVEQFDAVYKAFHTTAADFKGQIIFILVDSIDTRNGRIREFFHIRDLDIPAVRMINVTGTVTYRMEGDRVTAQTVGAFCRAYLTGMAKTHQSSEELADDWNTNPVKVLVGRNFEEVVFNSTRDVFVLFCAPWAERCKDIHSLWDQLGMKYAALESLVIAKIDITANEVDSVIVDQFPNVKYFPADEDRKIQHYTAAHTLQAWSQFLDKEEEMKKLRHGSDVADEGTKDEL
ncbi:protein disulfide-isomerase-like [Amblyraja radiata]|uniref:protein disulfide-isomerase-like n=1 Tax=Amblyraja radiata TaxID=386614 RepID=UPI001403E44C|nr:protein disulfide-isomerase-like [Amblyraja radiata]